MSPDPSMDTEPGQITALLGRVRSGDREAESQLLAMVYGRLKNIAAQQLRRERKGHTLQPSALVSELYLKLRDQPIDWQSRNHLFAVAATNVRRILVDYARKRKSQRRPPPAGRIDIEKLFLESPDQPGEMMLVDQALTQLAEYDPRQARIVELRIFGGLTVAEIAMELGLAERTIKRDWSMARAWLSKLLNTNEEPTDGAS
jgi:RNA polymerase sigma-70 factor (ECF subfamily)